MNLLDEADQPSSRRKFIKESSLALWALTFPLKNRIFLNDIYMNDTNTFDVIIVGGSYSGLAAAMALGRALRKVLVIDAGEPCNKQTPFSHNFITQDGKTPKEISTLAKLQVQEYKTVQFYEDLVTSGIKTERGFEIETITGKIFAGKKLIFATGIRDSFPGIEGFGETWGISTLHCPYCHGYEVRNEETGILSNGDHGFEFTKLISNWTKNLTFFTNGQSLLTSEQMDKLKIHKIKVIETEILKLAHKNGHLQNIILKNNESIDLKVLYAQIPFVQHSSIPQTLGCELTEDGYLKIDRFQKTNIDGIYACGDNASKIRTVANAVAMGTIAGMMLNKEMVLNEF